MIPHNRIAPPEKVVDEMVWALESGHLVDGFHTRQLADKLARLSGRTVVTLTKSGTRAWEDRRRVNAPQIGRSKIPQVTQLSGLQSIDC
jgi:dTDP-4-amino-4,6-dideoxygalactose transaminase